MRLGDKDTNINYRFSLPNKLFDYIHAGTAVLASNLVEVARIVNDYEVGKIAPSHDPKVLAETLREMLNDPDQLNAWKSNTKKASEELCWENEVEVLRSIYLSESAKSN